LVIFLSIGTGEEGFQTECGVGRMTRGGESLFWGLDEILVSS
jgi:hypothetical protein